MNQKRTTDTFNGGEIRRLVAELVDEAPTASSWSNVERRAEQSTDVASVTSIHSSTRRPVLMLTAAATVIVVGAVAVFVAGGSEPQGRIVPADADLPTTIEEAVLPTTEAPPIETDRETVPPETVEDIDSTIGDAAPDEEFLDDSGIDEAPEPVDYPERELASVTAIPADAWVVAGSLPDGITPRYATNQGGERTVAYGNTDGRSLTVMTSPQPLAGPNAIDVDGVAWSLEVGDGGATYVREIGATAIIVTAIGIEQAEVIPVLQSLRTGGDQLVPTDVIGLRNSADAGDGLEATDDDAYRVPVWFSAQGANGWYCIRVSGLLGMSVEQCGFGRNGQLASEAVWLRVGGGIGDDGPDRLVLAGIVAPDVAEIEVALADGTSRRTPTTGSAESHDDLAWILEIDLTSDDPSVDRLAGLEIRMLAPDGAVLGLVPLER